MQAADFLLEHLGRTLRDPVDRDALGSLDTTLRARVNGEIYRFSRPATLVRFRGDPVRWCGVLRDPVSGARFIPDRWSPRLEHRDGPYFFISDSTLTIFRADPVKYAIRRDY